ncbi:MAG: c-type cytochrome [Aquificae bacterium]|nr:c-type cytochrome [Aquificota bacterium]
MKKVILVLLGTGLISSYASGIDGKEIFEKNQCAICHKETKDSVGPSLRTIAEFYKNNPRQLIEFLKGQADPIIWPDKFNTMKPQMGKLKAMSDEEIKALADYMLKF